MTVHPRAAPSTIKLLTLSVLCAIAAPAWAQSAPAPAKADASAAQRSAANAPVSVEAVVVTGQGASLSKAVAAQERADNIVSVVSADDIGGLPDKNAAEALARMPGISVQRDQGEGRYVTVRGLGPQYNNVTINGALVPSPEASTRAVSLDVLPAGLIRSLEVSKTLTPDQDASSIGGSIEVKTLSAFDLPKGLLTVTGDGSYDENSKKTSPSGSVLWADRFLDGKLGVAAAVSLEQRKFGSDDVETGGAWTSANRLTALELRDYAPQRERNALGLNIDFRPDAASSYYLHSFASQFSDDEIRDRLTLSNIVGGSAADGQSVTGRIERRLRQRKYTREINSFVLGTEQRFAEWTLNASAAMSNANEDTPEQLNDARFRGASNFVGVGFNNTQAPILFGPTSLVNPASYNLNAITLQQRTSRDEEKHARFDVTRALKLADTEAALKAGAKFSRREKSNDTELWSYNSSSATSPNYWGAGSTSMSAFTRGVLDFPFGAIGPGIDPDLVRARVAALPRAGARNAIDSTLNDYRMNEDIDAAYVQASANFDKLYLLTGVRMERTQFKAFGSQIAGATSIVPLSRERSYSNTLPTLQGRYDLDPATSIRAAWTNSVVRANFNQLAPGVNLVSATEASIGNPDLEPLKSANFDVGIERMLGKNGSMSAYAFTKDIKNFTYTTNLAGTGRWVGYTTATSFANGDKARVNGIELAYSHALRGLPSPWDGLLVSVNATFTDSSANISRFDKATSKTLSRSIKMPGQSDRVMNLILGYEKGPISMRVALNYKSPYLLQVGSDILDAGQDLSVDTQKQLDFSLKYQASKSVQISFEAINLNNERYYVYQGSRPFNAQYEQYGRTFKLGIRANLF